MLNLTHSERMASRKALYEGRRNLDAFESIYPAAGEAVRTRQLNRKHRRKLASPAFQRAVAAAAVQLARRQKMEDAIGKSA